MNCEQINELLTHYALGDLDETTTAEVRGHVAECDKCKAALEEIAPTLELLREAFAEPVAAPAKLSETHRRTIFRRRRAGKIVSWVTTGHPKLAVAAGIMVVFGLTWVSILSVNRLRLDAQARDVGAKGRAIHLGLFDANMEAAAHGPPQRRPGLAEKKPPGITVAEPEAMEEIDEPSDDGRHLASLARSDTPSAGERQRAVSFEKPAFESEFMDAKDAESELDVSYVGASELAPDAYVSRKAEELEETRIKGSLRDHLVARPPEEASADFSPRPVEFDAVAMVKTPVIMKGINGARGSSARGQVTRHAGEGLLTDEEWANEDLDVEVTNGDALNAPAPASRPQRSAYLRGDESSMREDVTENGAGTARESRFKAVGVNPFVSVVEQPFSTFAIDVDTASYNVARNYMSRGYLPPVESVRTEEFVNSFDYGYKAPLKETFRIYADAAPSKFGRGLHLIKIGVKGRRLGREEQRRAALTFVIDTSGSMDQPDRLGLVKKALRMLVNELDEKDLIAIVQYGSDARLILEHTPVSRKEAVLEAINNLQCGGSTNLENGMRHAYSAAGANFVAGAENRVLLLSDGVANMGSGAAEDILGKIEQYRKQGITCSVFGVGMGTYNDEMLETLANRGDGTYTFIDSEKAARRVFVDDLAATLNTIAADVKIQVEFNADSIRRYRQLGYENRQLEARDFRNDAVDAGEVGSGQSVTALYEVELVADVVDRPAARSSVANALATVRVRYCRIDTGGIEEIEHTIWASDVASAFDRADARFRLAASAAEFAEILRGSPLALGSDFEDVARVLRPAALELNLDTRVQELLRLVHGAGSLSRGE